MRWKWYQRPALLIDVCGPSSGRRLSEAARRRVNNLEAAEAAEALLGEAVRRRPDLPATEAFRELLRDEARKGGRR